MRQRELTGRAQSSGAGLAKPGFVYAKSNKEVKSSIVLSPVPVQQMHMFPVCRTLFGVFSSLE